ncbi:MAG: EamA family transporter RarD [Opitutaceae bacterium]|nr:EamA family transporter RarD [Opitutaceae bacterium]
MTSGSSSTESTRGLFAAFACYVIWGIVPIYWKQMSQVDPLELVAHRVVWSLVVFVALTIWLRAGSEVIKAFRDGRVLALNLVSGLLLAINWVVYIWGVNAGHVIECSLGYFLVPIFNVVLGRVVLKETLRPLQAVAVVLTALGVGVLVLDVRHIPWIALSLALTFGFYGLLRKKSGVGAIAGLVVETSVMTPLAAAWLIWLAAEDRASFGRVDTGTMLLVLSTGVVTAIPLILFAYGAVRLRLTTLGLLQFAAPTFQFLIGWLIYHEPFSMDRAKAFLLIWTGLAVYSYDTWTLQRRRRMPGSVADAPA